jgi:hypothetical protein
MFTVVNGKELLTVFTKVFTGTTLLSVFNGLNTPAPWALVVPFFLTY